MKIDESKLLDALRHSMEKEIECCDSSLKILAETKQADSDKTSGWWEGRKTLAKELHDQILNEQLKGHI